MRKNKLRKLLLIVCLLLAACLPSSGKEYEIIHARLGGTDLYIPKEYVRFGHTSIGTESALLQAWYPGAAIVPGTGDNSTELWKQKIWWKNIRILATILKNKSLSFDEVAKKSTRHLNATVFVADEYGLKHFTQPQGTNTDKYDVWFDMNHDNIKSYITCSEKLTKIDTPQCSHWVFIDNKLSLQISYDRRFLPDWKKINVNVYALFHSFQTLQSAEEFLRRQIDLSNTKENK